MQICVVIAITALLWNIAMRSSWLKSIVWRHQKILASAFVEIFALRKRHYTRGIIQGPFDTRVKEYLFANTKKIVLISGENDSNVFFHRFEFWKINFFISRLSESFPPGTQYSGNIRWVFPPRCNVRDIQGTFREHFKGKYFLKSS